MWELSSIYIDIGKSIRLVHKKSGEITIHTDILNKVILGNNLETVLFTSTREGLTVLVYCERHGFEFKKLWLSLRTGFKTNKYRLKEQSYKYSDTSWRAN